MKRNELAEIKKIEITALRAKITKAQKEIADLILNKKINKIKNLKIIKSKRKEIAQMLTILKQRELVQQLEAKI